MQSAKLSNVVIIGGGVSGLAAALALHAINIPCTVYEVRAFPSTIGGAINLTPAALRCLNQLGVLPHLEGKGCDVRAIELFSALSGRPIGEMSYRNVQKHQYHALRIKRADLMQGLLIALEATAVKIEYGKKLVQVEETGGMVEATFEDGSVAQADMLLGCDGIHSITRMKLVDPERVPEYTGVSTAYGMLQRSTVTSPIHFEECAVNTARKGSLLTAFCDPDKKVLYFAAVMEVKEQMSREGWKVKVADQEATRKEILSRFGESQIPCLREMIENVEDLFFYPVNTLPPRGKWSSQRVMLLWDAAHAVCLHFSFPFVV